jgi:hypothetical protein
VEAQTKLRGLLLILVAAMVAAVQCNLHHMLNSPASPLILHPMTPGHRQCKGRSTSFKKARHTCRTLMALGPAASERWATYHEPVSHRFSSGAVHWVVSPASCSQLLVCRRSPWRELWSLAAGNPARQTSQPTSTTPSAASCQMDPQQQRQVREQSQWWPDIDTFEGAKPVVASH